MEQITRRDGIVYYGNIPCKSVKDAYGRFRSDYHGELGRRVYRRLDVHARRERIHGFKSFYTDRYSLYLAERFGGFERVDCTLMGIVGISYCYAIGGWGLPELDDDMIWEFVDYLMDINSNALRMVGKKVKTGRTAKTKKRYR